MSGELTWTTHRLTENWFRSIILIILLGLICLLVYTAFLNLWLTVLAVLLLFGSLRGFFLPVRYTLNRLKANPGWRISGGCICSATGIAKRWKSLLSCELPGK
ncbi:MAG: hypothetical protein HY762_04335 [Planctomycetes bacterium]|nr:hypothetical protein [Planctomycetota bacterium]